jgi:hypothetical protein
MVGGVGLPYEFLRLDATVHVSPQSASSVRAPCRVATTATGSNAGRWTWTLSLNRKLAESGAKLFPRAGRGSLQTGRFEGSIHPRSR